LQDKTSITNPRFTLNQVNLGFFNFKYYVEQLPLSDCIVNLGEKIVISIFFGLLVLFVIDTLHFIKIFYALIKEKDQN